METGGMATTLRSTPPPPPPPRRRIILFPLPFQGHINPMLQLANILHTQGFTITIIHTQFNSPIHSNYPYFTFEPISDGFSEMAKQWPAVFSLSTLILGAWIRFIKCLTRLLDEEAVACLITDAVFYFTQEVADELRIPRLVLWASCLGSLLAYCAIIPLLFDKVYLNSTKQDSNYDARVSEHPLLKVKDIVKMTNNPQGHADWVSNMLNQMKASSGVIWNTFKELEESTLETICQDYPIPSFILGPFHKYFSTSLSSLIEQDRSIFSWLDNQAPKSVIYISFGSVALITDSEFQEVAHGLANTGLPFLWVVRPGMVMGSVWLESLPERFLERVGDKGRIVKWSPQQEVLAHPATRCFWTHNGWNSTLESICEGVPMVCSPCFIDQPINARYVSDVWKIGILLEDGFERIGIEMAIKRLMTNEDMRKRINCLKEKVNISLEEGGSSHESLKSLVNYISSF